MLFRLGGKFRMLGLSAGNFVEFYPPHDWNARLGIQVFMGPPSMPGPEYFLALKNFRTPPVGAMSYQVRPDGSLLFLEENLP